MNMREYDEMQESMALLRMLADSAAEAEAGNVRSSEEVFSDLRARIAGSRHELG